MAKVERFSDYQQMSRAAAARVIAAVAAKGDSLLCAAAGNSPAGVYQELGREAQQQPSLFENLRVVKLDEWLDLPPGDAASCESFLRSALIEPLAISRERYIAFDAQTLDPSRECSRVQGELERHGPIDLCILGLGKNGHVGLIEPASSLQPHCHVAHLAPETTRHQMLSATKSTPTRGLTLGIGDLLNARKVLLLITGSGKERATASFLEGTVTAQIPASFLWLHRDVEVFLNEGNS